MEEKKNNKVVVVMSIILISIILLIISIILFILNVNKPNLNKDDKVNKPTDIQNEIADNNKKNIQLSLIDINFLKQEECAYLDFYGIDIISPEIFSITNCASEERDFSLINKNKEILDKEFQNGITRVYDDFFVDAPSYSGNTGYKAKLYDVNGILKLKEEHITFFSENIIFIGDTFSGDGKLYNTKNFKYSDDYKILQYVKDNAIMIQDEKSNIKIINSEFEHIKDFGMTNDEFVLLNDNCVFNKTKGNIIVLNNNKTIEKKYDEYYPLYNEYVEVCKNEKCGVINIFEDKVVVPLKFEDNFISLDYDDLTNIGSKMFNILNNNLILIDDKYVYNFNGKELFEFEQESYINTINNNYYIIEEYDEENTIKKIKVFEKNGNITFEDEIYNSFSTEYSDYNSYIAYNNSNKDENSKYGIVDINGNVFLDFKYDNIDIYDGFYILELNDQYAIYDYNKKEILPFDNYEIEWQNSNNNYDILMIQNLDTNDIQMLVTTFE